MLFFVAVGSYHPQDDGSHIVRVVVESSGAIRYSLSSDNGVVDNPAVVMRSIPYTDSTFHVLCVTLREAVPVPVQLTIQDDEQQESCRLAPPRADEPIRFVLVSGAVDWTALEQRVQKLQGFIQFIHLGNQVMLDQDVKTLLGTYGSRSLEPHEQDKVSSLFKATYRRTFNAMKPCLLKYSHVSIPGEFDIIDQHTPSATWSGRPVPSEITGIGFDLYTFYQHWLTDDAQPDPEIGLRWKYTVGSVQLVAPDLRSFKTDRTILGATQMEWLQEQNLKDSLLLLSTPLTTWKGYHEEHWTQFLKTKQAAPRAEAKSEANDEAKMETQSEQKEHSKDCAEGAAGATNAASAASAPSSDQSVLGYYPIVVSGGACGYTFGTVSVEDHPIRYLECGDRKPAEKPRRSCFSCFSAPEEDPIMLRRPVSKQPIVIQVPAQVPAQGLREATLMIDDRSFSINRF